MTDPWDRQLISKATTALLDFCKKEETKHNLLIPASPKYILVQVQFTESIPKETIKPVRVKIPHPVFSPEHGSACLFVGSDNEKSIREYLSQNPIPGLTEIIALDKVIKVYNRFQDRKKLLSQHTQFICDDRIVSHLYNALGKTFGDRHRFPVPVDIVDTEKITKNITKVLESTYIHLAGTNIIIRVGISTMPSEEILENVTEGLNFLLEKLGHGKFTKGLAKVHSIHMKTGTSPALPIYSKVPSEILQYVKTLANGDVAVAEEASEKTKKIKKGTKKSVEVLEDHEEEASTPSKGTGKEKTTKSLKSRGKESSTMEESVLKKATKRKVGAEVAEDELKMKKRKAFNKGMEGEGVIRAPMKKTKKLRKL